MKTRVLLASIAISAFIGIAHAGQGPSFSGDWTMDTDRSFGLPPNMRQVMKVVQTGEQIELETKLITAENENTIKDRYVIDGSEHEFTPQGPKGPLPGKGKRAAKWLPNGKGIVIEEETTTDTPNGPVTSHLTRKWTLSSSGELVIDMYIDGPNGSYETKRIFKKT
ncbi:MAG TPA: hypothetical protein VJ124_26280 [Pyrinomonadaceae bacterium]|nr:hypothetical protein [Pyrinomonadaceae bacterium]